MIWAYLIHLGQNFWRESEGEKSALGQWSGTMVTEDAAWREVVDFLPAQGVNTLLIDLGEGVRFDTHPELACEGAWSKEKLKKELDRIRALGMKPIPKLNFSACHDAWLKDYGHMISTKKYYQVVRELIDETAELFDSPELFHVGLDEEWAQIHYYQRANGHTCLRQGDLFWSDTNFLVDCCEKNHCRPWIWGDVHWYKADETVEKLSKDCVVSNAMYIRMRNPQHMVDHELRDLNTYFHFAEHGFEQIPTCATYYNTQNPDDTIYMCKDLPGDSGVYDRTVVPYEGDGRSQTQSGIQDLRRGKTPLFRR